MPPEEGCSDTKPAGKCNTKSLSNVAIGRIEKIEKGGNKHKGKKNDEFINVVGTVSMRYSYHITLHNDYAAKGSSVKRTCSRSLGRKVKLGLASSSGCPMSRAST
jgi:hypothetical protein